MKTIEEWWKGFEDHVVPAGASREHRWWIRAAFFAGALAFSKLMERIADLPADVADRELEALMQQLVAAKAEFSQQADQSN